VIRVDYKLIAHGLPALLSACFMLMMLASGQGIAAELQLAPEQAAHVFGGAPRRISIQFKNESTNETASASVRYRLYQSSSSTVVPVSSVTEWKTVAAGPGQVVTEVLAYSFPTVRAESTFHLVWFDGERKLGATRVRVFPENLLSSISNTPQSGVVDPSGYFSNALASVALQQLRDADEIGAFEGKLILVAPINEADRVNSLTEALKRRAASGVGVVWLQSAPSSDRASVLPAYVVGHGEGRFVIAQEALVNNLASSPLAQLRLLELIDLALGRKKLGLPEEPHASLSSRD
jgi:hypothetical protein